MDDPFIPQRGRRFSTGAQQMPNDGFAKQLVSIPLRRKRSAGSTVNAQQMRDLEALAYSLLRNSDALITDYSDDPFIPQRGRRSTSSGEKRHRSNDVKVKQTGRNKRSANQPSSDEERLRELTHFAYSLLQKSEPLFTELSDDPFIPQRGRRYAFRNSHYKQMNAKTKSSSPNASRGKRGANPRNSDEERIRELTNFAYSLLRKAEPLITDFSDDPFIPQRGRRSISSAAGQQQIEKSQSSRVRRSSNRNSDEERLRELTNFAYSLLRKTEGLSTDYADDPFVPQRGRRPNWLPDAFNPKRSTDSTDRDEQMRQLTNLAYSFLRNSDALITDYSDDPFIPQRGRRSKSTGNSDKSKRKANAQNIENARLRDLQNFAYSLLRNSISDYADDPFIPQRGRRANNNDKSSKFIGKLLPMPLKRKRSANAQSTEEKANLYKNQNMKNTPTASAATTPATHLLQKRQSNEPGPEVVETLSQSSQDWCCGDDGPDKTTTTSNQQQQQQQWLESQAKNPSTKFIVPNEVANRYRSNNDDEYALRAAVDGSLTSAKQILNAALETVQNQQNNLSQGNRDALYLARGSQTPFTGIEQEK